MNTKKYVKAIQLALEQLKIDEGCRLTAYQDTVGVWTIGYGRTGGVKKGDKITQEKAEELLLEDTLAAARDASTLPVGFDGLNAVRQAVLTNMTFNLGLTRILNFKRFLAAVQIRDFNKAALEMLDSKWAGQVGQRAIRLAKQMKKGEK
jgi:lysozyme